MTLVEHLTSRLRHFRRAIQERPIRLISVPLFVVGSLAAVHIAAVALLAFVTMWPPELTSFYWSEILGPLVFVMPVAAAGVGLVWLSVHVWEPSRRVRWRALVLWLISATLLWAIGLSFVLAALERPPPR